MNLKARYQELWEHSTAKFRMGEFELDHAVLLFPESQAPCRTGLFYHYFGNRSCSQIEYYLNYLPNGIVTPSHGRPMISALTDSGLSIPKSTANRSGAHLPPNSANPLSSIPGRK